MRVTVQSVVAPKPYLSAEITARRIRAAIGYSLKRVEEIEDAVADRISPATFKRIIAMTDPRPATWEEREIIAAATGVPHRFMEEGFGPLENSQDFAAQLAALRAETTAELAKMQSQLDTLVSKPARRTNTES